MRCNPVIDEGNINFGFNKASHSGVGAYNCPEWLVLCFYPAADLFQPEHFPRSGKSVCRQGVIEYAS